MAIITCQNRVIDWSNPNSLGGGLPGFIEVPVYIRQESGKTEKCSVLDLWFSCAPIRTWDGQGHFSGFGPQLSLQHLSSGFEFLLPQKSMWVNDVPYDFYGSEVVMGSQRLGAMWFVELNPNGGRFQRGFGWVHLMVNRFPTDFMKPDSGNVPCDGLACTVQVVTKGLMPGLYMFNVNAAQDLVRKTSLWHYNEFGQAEVPCLYKPTYLYIRHSEWTPPLGKMRGVDPDFPFEEFDIKPEDLMNQ